MITAQSGRQLEADCFMQGCDDFITKPLETKLLLIQVAADLDQPKKNDMNIHY